MLIDLKLPGSPGNIRRSRLTFGHCRILTVINHNTDSGIPAYNITAYEWEASATVLAIPLLTGVAEVAHRLELYP